MLVALVPILIFDVAMPAKRERCISYFNFLSGIGLGVGALLGGWLYRILPPIGGSSFFLLLGISTAARLLALLAIVVFTREVKKMIY